MKKIKLGVLALVIGLFLTGCGAKQFTITFDTNGGSKVESQEVVKGETITKPADPTREGYTFEGWFVGEEEYNFTEKVEKDVTLEAKWSVVTNADDKEEDKDDKEVAVKSIKLSKSSLTLNIGKSTTLKVTISPSDATNKKVTWKTSDSKIATVKDGKITALKEGTVTITATVDGKIATVKVTVKKAVTTTKKVEDTTTKATTTKATTTKVTTTKATTTKATTTKATTTKATTTKVTTTKKPDVISYTMEVLKDEYGNPDTSGKVTLYILKNGNKVAGKCDIKTNGGKTVTKEIPASGYVTNKTIIASVTNIVAN